MVGIMANLLNRTEAAALLKVTTQALDRALREGRINYADPAARLFDRAALVAQWAENRRRRRKPVPNAALVSTVDTPPAPTEAELRRRLLEAQTTAAEIAVREHAGKLVDVVAMKRELAARQALLLNRLGAVPDRLAAELGVDDDHRRRLRNRMCELLDEARRSAVLEGREMTAGAK